MTIETLSNLPLVEAQTQPIPAAVQTFYATQIALGSGPGGTYTITDFFGTAAGEPANTVLPGVIEILEARTADGTLDDLNAIYANMKGSVDGTFGDPTTGPIVIPSGPGSSGSPYADAEAALAVLIPLAEAEITALAAALGSQTTTLNAAFDSMAEQAVFEDENQTLAKVDFATISGSDQLSVMAFTLGIANAGTDIAEGQAAQFLESIADLSSIYGQAIVGAMREGRNNVQLDDANLLRYNTVPDQPETPPPAADLLS